MNKNRLLGISTVVLPSLCFPSLLAAQKATHPNIILFLVDDMGWQDTSLPFYGNEKSLLNQRFSTPNMERLAQMGVKFTHAYACSISSPTRCSLLSGMNAARHRVTNWTLNLNTPTDATSPIISLPEWNCNGLLSAQSDTTIERTTTITPFPEILRQNGYYTIHCGKAHFGATETPGANPLTMGFDVNIAGGANGAPASYLADENFGTGKFHVSGLERYYGSGKFLTEILTEEAERNMDSALARKKPFYLYMSHYAVHVPYSKDPRFFDHYNNRPDPFLTYLNGKETNINATEACYCALVEGMDKSLGDILDYVQRKGIADNTVILFMADNGGQAISARQGRKYTQNYPARAGKGSAFEGGVREPMIAYVPRVTKAGAINDNVVMIEDFYPTILELAGVKNYPTVQTIDGKSFANLLAHPDTKRRRTVYWHFPNLWGTGELQNTEFGFNATSSILKDGYKLIYTWITQEMRLYNVDDDIHENINLAARMPEKTADLAKDLSNYLRSVNAQRPSLKATGEPIGWPDEAGRVDSIALPFSVSTLTAKTKTWQKEGIHWYTMKLKDGYCTYDAATQSVKISATDHSPAPTDADLWAFAGNDSTGYRIYNKAAGTTQVLWTALQTSASRQPLRMVSVRKTDHVFWSINHSAPDGIDSHHPGGWNWVRKGSVDNFMSQQNNVLTIWPNVTAQSDENSAFTFLPYSPETESAAVR